MNTKYNFNSNMYKTVAKNIKNYRKLKNMSLEELSDYTDIKQELLEKIENNNSSISIYDLYKISVILDTSIDKFFLE